MGIQQSHQLQDSDDQQGDSQRRMYARFAGMIATSTLVMFLLSYTNVYVVDHIRWSEERFYMALLMGAAMSVIMLGFMWGSMYRLTPVNLAIVGLALLVGGLALWLSRSQTMVDDEAYMRGMIPHHSIAILTSERAAIEDLRVRQLADGIVQTQREEIVEMDWLVRDIEEHGVAGTKEQAAERPVPTFSATP